MQTVKSCALWGNKDPKTTSLGCEGEEEPRKHRWGKGSVDFVW